MPDQIQVVDNLKTVLDAGARASALIRPGDVADVLVIPNGYQALSAEILVEKYLDRPRRIKATPRFTDIGSFIAYLTTFAVADQSRLFSDKNGKMNAVLDYHIPGGAEVKGANVAGPTPAWGEHRAIYEPQHTVEWQRFTGGNKRHMSQTELAEFLEENQDIIVDPKGADLLELVQDLEGKNHIDCSSLSRLSNGKTKLVYSEEVELTGGSTTKNASVEFPSLIVAGISPFEGVAPYSVKARMRYRISNRKLEFWYEIIDQHLIIKSAVDDMLKLVQEKTGLVPLLGTP